MKLVQHPAVEAEIIEAVDYYEQRHKGLGLEFLEELGRAYQAVSAYPHRWGFITRRARRYRLKRFRTDWSTSRRPMKYLSLH